MAAADPSSGQGTSLLLVTTLALTNFMQALDQTIANVSLPAITGDLGAVPSQGAWIITSYAIANAITVPLTGWLANRFGQVRVFTLATMLFTLSSLLCTLAWSLESLIAFRLLQGAAGGLMLPLSQSLLMTHSAPDKRGMALAIWVSTTMIGPLFGPIIGGWICDNLHWSWIFLINLPVGILASAAVWQLLKDRDSPRRISPLDYVGLALLVVWVGALQLMLDKGNELDWFESDFIIWLGIVTLLGFALFLAWESGEAHPIVDLSLFRRRNFLVSVVTLALVFGTFRGMILILPLWLQTQVGYTAQWAGFVLAPSGILALLLVPVVGRTVGLVDPRLYATVAIMIYAICAFWRAHFLDSADFLSFAAPQFFQGAATAMFFAPLISISLGGIEPQRMAAAAGMQNFVRMMIGSFGTSLAVTFWDRRGALHRTELAEHVTASSIQTADYLAGLGAAGLSPEQSLAQLDRVLTTQAYTLATNDVFWVCSALLLALSATIWLARRPFGVSTAPAAE